ncbi:MAG: Cna B-type domain-containing protein, partial [Prevotella sp.]|nr:Cna B-type domain-containing protein [Prevotella sp.]
GTYSFTMKGVDGAPMPDDSAEDGTKQVQNDKSGNISFGSIKYTVNDLGRDEEGNYLQQKVWTYKITENVHGDAQHHYVQNGIKYDPNEYLVTVTLNYDPEDGKLEVSEPVYLKKSSTILVENDAEASKTGEGLSEANDRGTEHEAVQETFRSEGENDSAKYTPVSNATFENERLGSLIIRKSVKTSSETLGVGSLADGTYTFKVYKDAACTQEASRADGSQIGEVSISINGQTSEEIEVTDLSEGTYYVKEITSSNPQIKVNDNAVSVQVVSGKTASNIDLTRSVAEITNTFETTERHVRLIWAGDEGDISRRPESVTYTLSAKDAAGEAVSLSAYGIIAEASSSAGNRYEADWKDLPKYAPNGDEIVYDVIVSDVDNYTQTSEMFVTDARTWQFTYTLGAVTVDLKANVRLKDTDEDAAILPYQFELSPIGNAPMPQGADKGTKYVNNDEDGQIKFGTIGYTLRDLGKDAAGNYNASRDYEYTIRQVFQRSSDYNYVLNDMRYDPSIYTVKITLQYDRKEGILSVGQTQYTKRTNENDQGAGIITNSIAFENEALGSMKIV